MTRVSISTGLAVAIVLSILAATAPPVAATEAEELAQATDDLVVGSQHSTDTEFQNAQDLTNLTVSGSGESAVVQSDGGTNKSYNVVADSGDGTAESDRSLAGDNSADEPVVTEYQIEPSFTGSVTSLDVAIERTLGSGYGFTVDIYAVQESPDTTYQEGTLVKEDWSPDFQSGTQSISLDTSFDVSSGETWTLEFVTQSSDNDGTTDTIQIATDEDSALAEWASQYGTLKDWGGEITVKTAPPFTSGTYVSQVHNVSSPEEAAINITEANNVSIDATVRTTGGTILNQTTLSGTGNHTLTLSETSSEQLETVLNVDATGDNPAFSLGDESILFTPHAPEVSNPEPADNTTLTENDVNLSVDVNDADFGTAQGDTVDATFYVDGEAVATKSLTSNGTASTTVSKFGSGEWYVELEDEYGQTTTTETRSFSTPATLEIYQEQSPQQLVDGDVTVTVRAYAGETAISRNVTDGTMDLEGFPLDQPIVITTSAEGYVDRRILIEDPTEQQRIYLLRANASSADIVFQLSDKSGGYPPESSVLYVQKALNVSGEEDLQWQTITGDYFAADQQFPTTLATQQRYRIVVENQEGDRRVLGSYIPYRSTTTTLTIGEIVWEVPEAEGAYSTAHVEDDQLVVRYNDTENTTTRVDVTAFNRQTGEVVYQSTEYDTNTLQIIQPVNTTNLAVQVNASRTDSSDYSARHPVGQPDVDQPGGDPKWVRLAAQVFLLGMAGLVIGQMPKQAGLIIMPLAFGVTWLGFWEIHPASLAIGGVIALMSASNQRGGA